MAESDPADRIVALVTRLCEEIRPAARERPSVSLDSTFEQDLGLDSLARVELLARIERELAVKLPDRTLSIAETPRDLLRALDAAGTRTGLGVAARSSDAPVSGSSVPSPLPVATLVEALAWHARAEPDRRHIVLYEEDDRAVEITYEALYRSAGARAVGLRERDVQAGQCVALMLPTSREYFTTFAGAMLLGAVPVPIYPPARPSQIEDHLKRQAAILANARATVLVTVEEARPAARFLRAMVPSLAHVVTPDELALRGADLEPAAIGSGDIALLQYTSGSTGDPKGVVLTHGNLVANLRGMGQAASVTASDVFVSWLPLYHDMGLIGAWLGAILYGYSLVSMSPLAFLERPSRWLHAIHRHRGTMSAAPNFAYELAAGRIPDDEIAGLDLSSWRMAFNGAEPVSALTIERFAARFAASGFRREAMSPVYGLAENCLGVTFPPLQRGPVVDRVSRERLAASGRAEPAPDDAGAIRVCSSGRPLPGIELRIVDPDGRELPERRQGAIEFAGASASSGYVRNEIATAAFVTGRFRRTGDLGYMAGGELFVTGRAKDVIIRGGRNVYPQEVEEAIGALPGARKGCVAVFGVPDEATGTERAVAIVESRATGGAERTALVAEAQKVARDLMGMPLDDVVIAPPGTVPKTSSGKVRRSFARDLYRERRIGAGRSSVRWQVLRLSLQAARASSGRLAARAGSVLYAIWAWSYFTLTAPGIWLAVVFAIPGRALRHRFLHWAARAHLHALGMPLRIEGAMTGPGPWIVVANHASYLDPVPVVAALPVDAAFVAKEGLARSAIARLFLRRIGTELVERYDALQGAEDARRLVAAARGGRTLVFFAEGTFHRRAGLMPFRLGAFVAAVESGLPVVPITLRGTRTALRDGTWWPKPGPITVVLGAPIHPDGSGLEAAVKLRDATREAILRSCGEPDLADVLPLAPLPGRS
ncbi:MAG: AMP-binding protein [Acidobacteriota bacterium]